MRSVRVRFLVVDRDQPSAIRHQEREEFYHRADPPQADLRHAPREEEAEEEGRQGSGRGGWSDGLEARPTRVRRGEGRPV